MHEGGLLEGFLISLAVVGETREVVFELIFEGTIFIDLDVGFVFEM